MTIRIEGKGGIRATIIADSISSAGKRITTFELEYHRYIHGEFMTHRLFSRNAASSRAIPVNRMIELIKENTAMPIHWGKNQPGMSAKDECNELVDFDTILEHLEGPWTPESGSRFYATRETTWEWARDNAIDAAYRMHKAGYHKQSVNRLTEPFQFIKVVCTATEFANFFNLRRHPDAQPEIQELANVMWQAREQSTPIQLKEGDWHVPYYGTGQWIPDYDPERYSGVGPHNGKDYVVDFAGNTLQEALAISSSCCAQVSYRVLNDSLEKAKDIFKRLIESKPAHASPMEHQATPIKVAVGPGCGMGGAGGEPHEIAFQTEGITHQTRDGNYWSGNFCGWVQHRQLIPAHDVKG